MEEEAEGQVLEDAGGLDPEALARRELALAQIRQYGDPVLRMRAHDVTSFDEEMDDLEAWTPQDLDEFDSFGMSRITEPAE